MLPQGIFSVAITTVLFPSLARLAARGDQPGFRNTLALGLRQIAFLLIPASVVSALLAEPITRLVYQRGAFEPAQTPVVAGALAAFSAGLFFNGMMLLLNRGFFSLQSNWVPTSIALANLGLNAALDAAFYRFGTWGLPLATSLVNLAGSGVLLVLMRRRLGRMNPTVGVSAARERTSLGTFSLSGGGSVGPIEDTDTVVGVRASVPLPLRQHNQQSRGRTYRKRSKGLHNQEPGHKTVLPRIG